MTINTASGAKLALGTTASAAVLADFLADSYIEVGEIEDLGEFGDESQTVEFISLSDSRVRKLKGPRDAGTQNIVVGDDMTDEGQIAMDDAERTKFDYNIRIELNDAVTLGGSNSFHYFRGKVMSRRRNVGNATNVIRKTYAIGINSDIIEVLPT
jgi:hypothetical protein